MSRDRMPDFDRWLWPTVAALVLLFALFELTSIDLWVQDHFFDFGTGTWWVDRDDPLGRALFYTGPKAVIIVLGVGVIALLVGPAVWRRRFGFARRDLGVALLCLAVIPTAIGYAKARTNVFCPSEIRRYGGEMPYVKVLERYPENDRPARCGRCFPAGHASGGFALFGLAWLRATRRWRMGGLGLALGVGWGMGLYQMFKGAHYLSHTVTTMLVAWILALAFRRLLRAHRSEGALASGGPAA